MPWTIDGAQRYGASLLKQLGAALGVEPDRLYYHLRILEAADLIAVSGTTATGRMVEKLYRATSGSYGNERQEP